MKTVQLSDTLHSIITKYPEIQNVLVELGFKPMGNMINVNTVGRVTNLQTAINHLSMDPEVLKEAFLKVGVEVLDHE